MAHIESSHFDFTRYLPSIGLQKVQLKAGDGIRKKTKSVVSFPVFLIPATDIHMKLITSPLRAMPGDV